MVFISFLGTSSYVACNYVFEGQSCDNVCFIQTAIHKLLCPHAEQSLIFVTKSAEEKNLAALIEERERFDLPAITRVPIPEGKSEEELWKIFSIVSEQIPENSELIFDITHSFRSLPLLMTLLLNYLHATKQVKLAGCYYGAFEKLGNPKQAGQMPLEERNAPIFNLTPFFSLNTWTEAISHYTEYGRSNKLFELASTDLRSILKQCKGDNESARTLKNIIKAIHDFCTAVYTANCTELYAISFKTQITDGLSGLQENALLPPLTPVLHKVRDVFADYEDISIKNGLRAACWCSQHDLMPQGFTILQETIVSLEVEQYQDRLATVIKEKVRQREFISGLLAILAQKRELQNSNWNTQEEKNLAMELAAEERWPREFLDNYNTITTRRNQVNHGGTGNNNFKSQDVGQVLKQQANWILHYYSTSSADTALSNA